MCVLCGAAGSTRALGTQTSSAMRAMGPHEAPHFHLGNAQVSYVVLFVHEVRTNELFDVKGLSGNLANDVPTHT